MIVFITARPGVGKSTVTKGLAERGLASYDLEEIPDVMGLEDKATGQLVAWPTGIMNWSLYSWNIQDKPLHDFLDSLPKGTTYISASANNQLQFYELFDIIIGLTLTDVGVLRHRLETREAKAAGFAPENIDRSVKLFATKNTALMQTVDVVIDNSRPLNVVLDEIEKVVRDHQ